MPEHLDLAGRPDVTFFERAGAIQDTLDSAATLEP